MKTPILLKANWTKLGTKGQLWGRLRSIRFQSQKWGKPTFGRTNIAHPEGHDYERPQRKPVRELAKDAIVKLVTQSKLPSSWAKVDASGANIVTVGSEVRWVVTFENPAVKKTSERKLYVTMTSSGEFVSASFKAA